MIDRAREAGPVDRREESGRERSRARRAGEGDAGGRPFSGEDDPSDKHMTIVGRRSLPAVIDASSRLTR